MVKAGHTLASSSESGSSSHINYAQLNILFLSIGYSVSLYNYGLARSRVSRRKLRGGVGKNRRELYS